VGAAGVLSKILCLHLGSVKRKTNMAAGDFSLVYELVTGNL
jgi:hypothetical protein